MAIKYAPPATQKEISKKLDLLVASLDRVYPPVKHMIWRSFMHGLFVSLGATVGVTLLIGIATFIVAQAKIVPGLNQFIDQTQIENVLPMN